MKSQARCVNSRCSIACLLVISGTIAACARVADGITADRIVSLQSGTPYERVIQTLGLPFCYEVTGQLPPTPVTDGVIPDAERCDRAGVAVPANRQKDALLLRYTTYRKIGTARIGPSVLVFLRGGVVEQVQVSDSGNGLFARYKNNEAQYFAGANIDSVRTLIGR